MHVANNIMLLWSLLSQSEHDEHNLGWPSNHHGPLHDYSGIA